MSENAKPDGAAQGAKEFERRLRRGAGLPVGEPEEEPRRRTLDNLLRAAAVGRRITKVEAPDEQS